MRIYFVWKVWPISRGSCKPSFAILMLPFQTARFTCPLFRAPDEEKVVQVDILRNAPSDPDVIEKILAYNRKLYDRNRELGGTNYPISAVRMERRDWKRHYGPSAATTPTTCSPPART